MVDPPGRRGSDLSFYPTANLTKPSTANLGWRNRTSLRRAFRAFDRAAH